MSAVLQLPLASVVRLQLGLLLLDIFCFCSSVNKSSTVVLAYFCSLFHQSSSTYSPCFHFLHLVTTPRAFSLQDSTPKEWKPARKKGRGSSWYHRRHKVCEFHAKAAVVLLSGLRQRFCQQCSRFHELSEFDEAKRSCRRRLAGHNERRRKSSYDS